MENKRRAEAVWVPSHGYWQVKVQKDGERRPFTSKLTGRKGKHDAEAKADAWLREETVDMRFPAAWELFMQEQRARTGTSNVIKHEQYCKNFIAPVIKARKVSTITPIHWQRCIDAAGQKGLSERTCMNIRGTISAFVSFALRARWDIQRLEKGDLKIPRNAAPKKEKVVLQPDDIRTLFTDPYFPHYGKPVFAHYIYAWRFMVATGLRRGELCGLKESDIRGNTLTVRRSINSLGEITDGKNRNARRTIELSATATKILNDQLDYLDENGFESEWLFPNTEGDTPDPNQMYDHWATYRKHHGIKSSLHELRHTFISLNKADMPLELMKAMVGHSASMDTFAVYGHEVEGDRHRAAQIVDSVFDDILKNESREDG